MHLPTHSRTEPPQQTVLAVDGGGSKTTVWIAAAWCQANPPSSALEVIGRGQAGPSNPRAVGFEQAFANIETAIQQALQQAAIDPTAIGSACLSLAGAGREDEQRTVRDWAALRPWARRILVVDDIEPLPFAAAYEQCHLHLANKVSDAWCRNVSLVVGTGSMARGSDEHGASVRVGGWGYLLGDEGSGYAMGLESLRSICLAHDRRAAATPMHKAILKHLAFNDPVPLIAWVYQSPVPRRLIAELAEIVLAFADRDPAAMRIVENAVAAMAECVAITAKRLDFSEFEFSLALSGGILRYHPWLVTRLMNELASRSITPRLSHVIQDPVYGPLMMAFQDQSAPTGR